MHHYWQAIAGLSRGYFWQSPVWMFLVSGQLTAVILRRRLLPSWGCLSTVSRVVFVGGAHGGRGPESPAYPLQVFLWTKLRRMAHLTERDSGKYLLVVPGRIGQPLSGTSSQFAMLTSFVLLLGAPVKVLKR